MRTIRTRRPSYVTGKFLGLWATCSLVALAMHMLIWVIVIARGEKRLKFNYKEVI